MTTDRELLELAAKAVGYRICHFVSDTRAYVSDDLRDIRFYWQPGDDDGDNRRLQVKLKVGLVPVEDGGWACVTWDHDDEVTLAVDIDPNFAVVRAAAEIGRQMK